MVNSLIYFAAGCQYGSYAIPALLKRDDDDVGSYPMTQKAEGKKNVCTNRNAEEKNGKPTNLSVDDKDDGCGDQCQAFSEKMARMCNKLRMRIDALVH